MPTTEVYMCKPGQKLKDGRMDYAAHIETKEQAQADAKRRFQLDPSLAKVAYYQVREDGSFRVMYSEENKRAGDGGEAKSKPKSKATPKPKGLVGRFKDWLYD